jgi:hypothetical protein
MGTVDSHAYEAERVWAANAAFLFCAKLLSALRFTIEQPTGDRSKKQFMSALCLTLTN